MVCTYFMNHSKFGLCWNKTYIWAQKHQNIGETYNIRISKCFPYMYPRVISAFLNMTFTLKRFMLKILQQYFFLFENETEKNDINFVHSHRDLLKFIFIDENRPTQLGVTTQNSTLQSESISSCCMLDKLRTPPMLPKPSFLSNLQKERSLIY